MCTSTAGTCPQAASFDCLHGVKPAQCEIPDFWKLDPTSAEKTAGQGAQPGAAKTSPGHRARADEGFMGQLRRQFMVPSPEGRDGLQGHHWSEPAENSGFVLQPLTTALIIWSMRNLETPPTAHPGHHPPVTGPPALRHLTICLQHLPSLLP